MSVTDPLLKKLKLSFQPFLCLQTISDKSEHLTPFCEAVERILLFGRAVLDNAVPSPWAWMNAAACEMENGTLHRVFSYVRCVEEVRANTKIKEDSGRLRLLVRCCLKNKCLNIPIEIMVRKIGDRKFRWYQDFSIVGHSVLGEIFLSVILQAGQLNFDLDTSNARFLDFTWSLADNIRITFVPCDSLGIGIRFLENWAVILHVEKGSVAAEDGRLEAGDILDELNGETINLSFDGKLKGVLSKCKNQPISIRVIKSYCSSKDKSFSLCAKTFRKVQEFQHLCHLPCIKENKQEENDDLYYLGCTKIGGRGDVAQIDKGIRNVLAKKETPTLVIVQCRELDLLVISEGAIFMRHPFVTIASCGHSIDIPKHFAFLVGNDVCDSATEYTCHVFTSSNGDVCAKVLMGLSLGFERTQCAV